ncbi:ECM14 [Candida margitis]|uniref:ECM14 n=1 Tax=Candida margitis TaxID=1775924 RepID=UPI002226A183|nr:ECM14 [Candida margitis]KAI5966035.1 ECM14 [Candida margitis]
MMKLLLSLVFLLQTVWSFQFPFAIPNLFSSPSYQHAHYSKLDPDDQPIDLLQYKDDVVIRVSYASSPPLKEFLANPKEVQFNKWGKNSNQHTIDIQIEEEELVKLIEKFPSLEYHTIIEDLPQHIYETFPVSEQQVITQDEDFHVQSELFFKEYRDLATINSWLNLLQATYPEVVKIEEIGDTFEHRKLNVVHFSVPNDDIEHHNKKTIVITGGVHAREWISVSSTLYMIYQLVKLYGTWPNSKILTQLNFLFIPVTNPDGYEYTWTTDRLWRKNRQETPIPRCFGIDIDHSYGYHWTKSSDWACGEEYSGEFPFEAFESRLWDEYLNNTNKDHTIYGYIDLHSYSQEILYPYAYSCEQQPRDEENLIELAWGIAKSIRMKSGSNYNVLPACIDKDSDLLPDLGAGSALDYMYHNRAFWAYQFKLRDTGGHGFLLPAKYIEPVGDEIVSAILYFCKFILSDDR